MNRSPLELPRTDAFHPKHYVCRRAPFPLQLDGKLNKTFWESADWTDDFVDIEGDAKPAPTKRTRVKMLWDDECFYIGAELEENQIWATLTERDSVIFHDNDFEVFIDPDGDSHHYYELEVNALNTVWDLLLIKPYRDGGPPVNGWDISGLRTAIHIDGTLNDPAASNRLWSVEIALPWHSLKECAAEGRPPRAGEYWRVNFSRVQWQTDIVNGAYVKRTNPSTGNPYPEDNWVWSPMGLINMHYPELWGYVVFANREAELEDFALPPDERVKWELRKLYYAQRNYYAKHGKFAIRAEELTEELPWPVDDGAALEATSKLFHASLPSADGRSRFYIREDGKLWRE